jgi:cell division protein FtsI (penicillin-binding protein 3)
VANGGKMMKPMLVQKIMDHGENVKNFKPSVMNAAICSKPTIRKAQKLLEGVVENGTARNLKNLNYKIAGKTGTAQIANEKYGYSKKSEISYQASFVGYFPANDPKYSCIVVVNSPSKNVYYGNIVAGPVFKEIADKVYATSFNIHEGLELAKSQEDIEIPYTKHSHRKELKKVLNELNIKTKDEIVDSDWVVTRKMDSCIKLANRYIKENTMPKVIGMGVKDAVYILENMGLNVSVVGRGSIRKQSIPPGTRIQKGEKVELEMTFKE